MSGRAGYDMGKDIGKMMEHKFTTTFAKIVSKIGQIGGIGMLFVGIMIMMLDSEMALAGFLTGVGGVVLLLVLHWIALQIDKKCAPKA